MRGQGAALAASLLALAAGGCLGDVGGGELTVSTAASLSEAFEAYTAEFEEGVRFSFGGSDELAAQLRQGARPDVIASSDISQLERLHDEGLVANPVAFAGNRLVIAAVPGAEIASLGDLARPGVDLLLAAEGVPAGDYSRSALEGLPAEERDAILANVRSEESDVKGVIGKLVQGAGDAGLVYATDVVAVGDALRALPIPDRLQPEIAYGAAVAEGTTNPEAAQEFVDGLLAGPGAAALREAGFLPAPAR